MKSPIKASIKWLGLSGFLLFIMYALIYKLAVFHLNSFGCFDECMNYQAGYFLSQGRHLYSEIFFNHQPIMAYLSFLTIKLFHPANMFEFLLRHKQLLIGFSFLFNLILIQRFKFAALGFVIVFELSKYYLFGDRFLGEAFAVYPAVYLLGLLWEKLQGKIIKNSEYFLAAILTFIIIFLREPFILLAIAMLAAIIGIPSRLIQKIAYGAFIAFCLVIVFLNVPKEYFYQVFTINSVGVGVGDVKATGLFGSGIFSVFFYPVVAFFNGFLNEFRLLLVGTSIVFCFLFGHFFIVQKKRWSFILLFFLLGLANIRYVLPGELFYSAFHMIVWWGMFVFLTFAMLVTYGHSYKKNAIVVLGFLIIMFGAYLFLAKDFLWIHPNPQKEFLINFGDTYAIGSIVNELSSSKNTYFIDDVDSVALSYVQSQRSSPYAYGMYDYIAPSYSVFRQARYQMFANNLPDFYYGILPKKNPEIPDAPARTLDAYIQLYQYGKPFHLYVKKSIYNAITDEQWTKVATFGITKDMKYAMK